MGKILDLGIIKNRFTNSSQDFPRSHILSAMKGLVTPKRKFTLKTDLSLTN